MFDFWEDELTDEETESLLQKAGTEIRKRKLEGPAVLYFEMHKPVSNVFAHAGVTLAPFLVPFLGYEFVNNYSSVLRKRDNVERLIEILESPPAEPESLEDEAAGKMEGECQKR